MICDEEQKIKTPNAMVSRAAKKQNARFKIACTGTPVENTLTDLWCLFDFIQPGLLGSLRGFAERYRRPIKAETDEEKSRVGELRRLIASQTLRRIKAEVAKDLPPKIVDRGCRSLLISEEQRVYYNDALSKFKRWSRRRLTSRFLRSVRTSSALAQSVLRSQTTGLPSNEAATPGRIGTMLPKVEVDAYRTACHQSKRRESNRLLRVQGIATHHSARHCRAARLSCRHHQWRYLRRRRKDG